MHAHVHGGNLIGDEKRVQNQPTTGFRDNYRVDFNTTESEWPNCSSSSTFRA